MVLHQILLMLYPPEVLDKAHKRFAPLGAQTFRLSVLLPEAALALIKDDLKLTRAQALKTMRDSSRYGCAMFPDDEDGDGGVCEAMMRERARQRRKEIEKEEAKDLREGDSRSVL